MPVCPGLEVVPFGTEDFCLWVKAPVFKIHGLQETAGELPKVQILSLTPNDSDSVHREQRLQAVYLYMHPGEQPISIPLRKRRLQYFVSRNVLLNPKNPRVR